MASRDKLFTITFDTKRVGATVGGLEPNPTPVLSGIACLPLYPVNMEMKISMGVDPTTNLQATITFGDIDVLQGDIMIVDSGEFNIRWVETWAWRPTTPSGYYRILVEEGLD